MIFFYNENNILYKNYINNYLEKIFENINTRGGSNSEKQRFLKVMPSIINIIKGRLIYNLKSQLPLIEIKNKNKVTKMGIILNISNILNITKKTEIIKKDIMDYVSSFQVVPLFF